MKQLKRVFEDKSYDTKYGRKFLAILKHESVLKEAKEKELENQEKLDFLSQFGYDDLPIPYGFDNHITNLANASKLEISGKLTLADIFF